jgi:hypothetical protein
MDEAMPQPGDVPTGKAPALGPPTGPGICPPEDATLGTMVIAPGSSDIVDFRANELGLLGYPRVLPRPPARGRWREVWSRPARKL